MSKLEDLFTDESASILRRRQRPFGRPTREWFAQAYNDGLMRIFWKNKWLYDVNLPHPLKYDADEEIINLGFRRIGAWKDRAWGSEAVLKPLKGRGRG